MILTHYLLLDIYGASAAAAGSSRPRATRLRYGYRLAWVWVPGAAVRSAPDLAEFGPMVTDEAEVAVEMARMEAAQTDVHPFADALVAAWNRYVPPSREMPEPVPAPVIAAPVAFGIAAPQAEAPPSVDVAPEPELDTDGEPEPWSEALAGVSDLEPDPEPIEETPVELTWFVRTKKAIARGLRAVAQWLDPIDM